MNALNKREKRAMNRIRKRHAELMLLDGSDGVSKSAVDGHSNQPKKYKQEQPEIDQILAGQVPTTSAPLPVAVDNLLEQARALSRKVQSKIADHEQQPRPREAIRPVLQLHKLRSRFVSERELAAFLHRMMLGSHNAPRGGSNWIRFEGGKKPLQIVLVRVNCEDKDMLHTKDDAKFIDSYFHQRWLQLHQSVRDRNKFWTTISTVVQSNYELLIRKIKTSGDPLLSMRVAERKAQLLLSLEQMVDAKFPFPTDVFHAEEQQQKLNETKIRTTRKLYRPVSENSPIFVLDCEMCQTSADRLELTRISVVNEAGETLMDELVKPYNKIVNYITHKSGITEQLLRNVHTRLKDVQKRFCALLTDDAILCGHSLENDLQAMQLSHPFCMDTSLLFNFSGRLHIRSGLKALAKIFLDEDIQDSAHGHCSLQDAQITLKLLRFKLDKGIQFGNVALGWNFAEWARAHGMTVTGTRFRDLAVVKTEEIESVVDKEEKTEDKNELSLEEITHSSAVEVSQCSLETAAVEEANIIVASPECTEEAKEPNDTEEQIQQAEEAEQIGNKNNYSTEDKPQREEVSRQKEPKPQQQDGQFFDFTEAIRIDNALQKTAQLSDCFHLVHDGKRPRKMLVALPDCKRFFAPNESCTLIDLSGQEWISPPPSTSTAEQTGQPGSTANLHSICAHTASKLINYDFAFLELNCQAGMPKRELDEAFELLTNGICNNGMIMAIMSAGRGKDGQAILYQRVHRKKSVAAEEMPRNSSAEPNNNNPNI